MSSRAVQAKLSREDRWRVVKAYVDELGLVRQHLDSFNAFLERGLQEIVDEVGGIKVESQGVEIKFGKIEVGQPTFREADGSDLALTPMIARLRNITYAAPLYLTMTLYVDGEERRTESVYIGSLPIMVKSKKCVLYGLKSEDEIVKYGEDPYDPGGYFIVNGSERVIVMQEDLSVNRVLVDYGGASGSVTHTAKVFSVAAGQRSPLTVERTKDGMIYASFPACPSKIPVVVLMRALGLKTDQEIAYAIGNDPIIQQEFLPVLMEQSKIAATPEEALDYIGSRVSPGQPRNVRIERAQAVLDENLLPHIGRGPAARISKAFFVGQMVSRLLELKLGMRGPDDKDHLANKRIRQAGELIAQVFRSAFRQLVKEMTYSIERHTSKTRDINLVSIVRPDIITERLNHALATGNWVGGRTGVSQILDRTNYLSTISHLRRVVSPLSRTQPHFEARELHPTQWGRLCPVESPEGQNCGLVKHLALLATLSNGTDEKQVYDLLVGRLGVVPVEKTVGKNISGARVYLNGRLIGYVEDGKGLAETLRKLRREGRISHEVNVAFYSHEYTVGGVKGRIEEVYVNCDAGRIRRPLIVVENGEPRLKHEHVELLRKGEWTWSDLIENGIVEYLDAEEEENAYIATDVSELTPQHTHLEIVPAAILGIIAMTIPFIEYNQSPRNSYQAAMAKQSLGIPHYNFKLRMDPRMHVMYYPQKPLVKTRIFDLLPLDNLPYGTNMVVAVLTGGGYNIQDAVVINKAAIERGMSRSVFFRTYEAEERRYPGGLEDRFEKPSLEKDLLDVKPPQAYEAIDPVDGIAYVEAELYGGQAVVSRTSPPRFYTSTLEPRVMTKRKDTSLLLRHGEKGIIDRVFIMESPGGIKLAKVRVRDLRPTELGDKFASRHGQKGVVGMLVPQEDMPFTEEGITPDLIINPHAIPSRMTVGQLLEAITGKAAALAGRRIDATAFEPPSLDEIREILRSYGFRSDGKEVLYDGVTGEKLEAEIFIGVVYYEKLHHLVADKMHARARGRVQILTRQPTEGRAREGGLRFGEMEKDCLVGHGASMLLRERLLESSDKTTIWVCENCGYMGWFDARKNTPVCPVCGDKGRLSPVEVSYAFKLLLQELTGLGLSVRLILKDKIQS
ncbi:DNA-directed RNA polymerase subunit B [Thermofilum pendens]|uniref:DNA-directed RNA polymerase subunit beta n=1 Tax=Thermofilum pendens (strain DSM 2475 / Hrk 5) TaxID=368408 RepID=A1RWW6_THEPD|nr:DNA-directed RNA polymerase subunit B [Thermofilum pendens]ABL77696.1 DNA-directed RNA polymerase, subunit B' [Thermofilum pendens Hrk 5]